MKIKRDDLLLVTIIFIVLVYFFPQIGIQHSPLLVEDQNLMLFQPYEDKVLYARSNISEDFIYSWYINDELKETDTSNTLFLAHFDGSLISEDDESPLLVKSESYEPGKFSQGLVGVTNYSTTNNIDLNEGTIEFWLTLKQPLDSTVFDDNPYIFTHINSTTQDYLVFRVYDNDNLYFTILENSDWGNSVQLSTSHDLVKINEPMHFALVYSKVMNRSSLYLDGFKIGSGKYNHNLELTDRFQVGNENVVIDEFRILNKALSNKEVLASYSLGIPFSSNDIYFDNKTTLGDNIKINITTSKGEYIEQTSTIAPLIQNLTPEGFFVQNTNEINFNFDTEQSVLCRYSNIPKPFGELSTIDSSPTTEHSFTIPVDNTINFKEIYIKCQDDKNSFYKRIRVLPQIKESYPKIATYLWGSNIEEHQTYNLSRYDIIGISRGALLTPSLINQIREYSPKTIILPYLTAIGIQGFGGSYQDDLFDRLDDSMRLQNAAGDFATNPSNPNNFPYNLYVGNPFSEVYSDHISEDIISRGDYDGIWFDVVGSTFWFLKDYETPGFPYTIYPDIDMDGADEDLDNPTVYSIARGYWMEGINKLLNLTNSKIGNTALIVGNTADAYPSNYEGKVWEGKLEHSQGGSDDGPVHTFLEYSDSTYMTRSFPYWNQETSSPHLNWNLFTNDVNVTLEPENHYARHRLGLAASIIGEVYHDSECAIEGCRELDWYDEYWVDPITADPTNISEIGSGYLGTPISEATLNNSIWRKDFQNGIVLLNQNISQKTTELNKTYRYINGIESPLINKGGFTSKTLTINGKDGIILLRSLCSDNPSEDPHCISYCGDSICGTSETCSSCSQDCGVCDDSSNPGGNGITPPPGTNETDSDGEDDSDSINQINLDSDNIVEIEVSGGQYVIVAGGINSVINIYNVEELLLTLIHSGNIIEIPLHESREITINEETVKISYLEYSNNKAKISFSKEVFSSLTPYKSQWPLYFILFTITYVIAAVIFISVRNKSTSKYSRF